MAGRRPPLVFIFTVTLTGILSNTLVSPALPDILAEFDVSPGRAGLLVAAGSVAGIVIAPLVGILSDRYGRRSVLATCLGVFGAFGVLAAFSPNFEFLLVARFLQGFGSAGLVNLAVVLIGDHWSGAERTRIVGRNAAVLTVGLAVLPLLSGTVTELFGWRVTFGIYTVALLTAVATLTVLDSRRPVEKRSVADQLGGIGELVRQPVMVTMFAAGFIVFVLIFGLFLTVLPVHLAQRFGMEAGGRGALLAAPAIGSTVMSFNLGRIKSVWGARQVVTFSSVGFMISFATMGVAPAVLVVVLAAVLYGLAEGLIIPSLQDEAMGQAPDEHRGAVVAVFVSAARAGQTVGPLLAGVAMDVWATSTVFVVGAAMSVSLLVLARLSPLRRLQAQTS